MSITYSFSLGVNTGYGGGWLPLTAILSRKLGEHVVGGVVEGVQCADYLLLGEGQCPSESVDHLGEADPGGAVGG